MSDMARASGTDLEEAYLCGVEAVKLAGKGDTGNMVSIERMSDEPYMIRLGKVPLKDVAVSARPMPDEYFNEEGNNVSQEFIEYMKPLAADLPEFVRLETKMVKRK
jgi:6-phosphofructokinase 1